jgi:uncharacterized membrane protein YkvA (DUF1232 family)
MQDPETPKKKKFLIIFGIIYLLSPIDLVPEPVFGVGFIDDIILWVFLITYLGASLDKYEEAEPLPRRRRRKFEGKDVYEAEGRVVEDEEESEGERKSD